MIMQATLENEEMMALFRLEPNISDLAKDPDFRAKAIGVYEKSNHRGGFRVHWRGVGWIRFSLDASGAFYRGWKEED